MRPCGHVQPQMGCSTCHPNSVLMSGGLGAAASLQPGALEYTPTAPDLSAEIIRIMTMQLEILKLLAAPAVYIPSQAGADSKDRR